MQLERVEKLRLEYTDQYVVVDGDLPQLAQFRGRVGRVYSVNHNGRALVEFEGDRGRYDLELDYLKVVDKPKPKEPPAKAAKAKAPAKPAAEGPNASPPEPPQKLSELELARQKKAAEKPKTTQTSPDETEPSVDQS